MKQYALQWHQFWQCGGHFIIKKHDFLAFLTHISPDGHLILSKLLQLYAPIPDQSPGPNGIEIGPKFTNWQPFTVKIKSLHEVFIYPFQYNYQNYDNNKFSTLLVRNYVFII